MSFMWPQVLIGLIAVPLFALLYIWQQRRRKRYVVRYSSLSMVRDAVGKGPGVKRHVPAVVYLGALATMVVAMARPQASVDVPHNTGTVVLSIDVSGSMMANDVKPDRMEATKEAVRRFVRAQPAGVKVGIVSFSDFGSLVQPPTRDRDLVLRAIDRLRPQRGTNIGGGLQVALDAIFEGSDTPRPTVVASQPGGPNAPAARAATPRPAAPPAAASTDPVKNPPPASIVLISDGESNVGPAALEVAQEAVLAGIKVYTVGIGTKEGTVLNIQGRRIPTRLDEDTLRGIADMTKAKYFSATNEADLIKVYDDLARERQLEKEKTEVTFMVTLGALVLSVIGGALSLLWFNRLP